MANLLQLQETINQKTANFKLSIKLKYVKLGYHYFISNAIYVILIPVSIMLMSSAQVITNQDYSKTWNILKINLLTVVLCLALLIVLATVYLISRSKKVYLVDFAIYKPEPDRKTTKRTCMDRIVQYGTFSEENVDFQRKIFERSSIGDETYLPESVIQIPPKPSIDEARKETERLMFIAIDELLEKTGVRAREIGILVVNCSLFNPLPSLSAMVVNRYKLRGNIKSYNLGGMGCSAGLISIDLAKDLLQV